MLLNTSSAIFKVYEIEKNCLYTKSRRPILHAAFRRRLQLEYVHHKFVGKFDDPEEVYDAIVSLLPLGTDRFQFIRAWFCVCFFFWFGELVHAESVLNSLLKDWTINDGARSG